MIPVKIAMLKAKLSFYLGRVRKGDELLVLDRNTPIARVVPSPEALQLLVIKPARNKAGALARLKPLSPKRRTESTRVLREERDSR